MTPYDKGFASTLAKTANAFTRRARAMLADTVRGGLKRVSEGKPPPAAAYGEHYDNTAEITNDDIHVPDLWSGIKPGRDSMTGSVEAFRQRHNNANRRVNAMPDDPYAHKPRGQGGLGYDKSPEWTKLTGEPDMARPPTFTGPPRPPRRAREETQVSWLPQRDKVLLANNRATTGHHLAELGYNTRKLPGQGDITPAELIASQRRLELTGKGMPHVRDYSLRSVLGRKADLTPARLLPARDSNGGQSGVEAPGNMLRGDIDPADAPRAVSLGRKAGGFVDAVMADSNGGLASPRGMSGYGMFHGVKPGDIKLVDDEFDDRMAPILRSEYMQGEALNIPTGIVKALAGMPRSEHTRALIDQAARMRHGYRNDTSTHHLGTSLPFAARMIQDKTIRGALDEDSDAMALNLQRGLDAFDGATPDHLRTYLVNRPTAASKAPKGNRRSRRESARIAAIQDSREPPPSADYQDRVARAHWTENNFNGITGTPAGEAPMGAAWRTLDTGYDDTMKFNDLRPDKDIRPGGEMSPALQNTPPHRSQAGAVRQVERGRTQDAHVQVRHGPAQGQRDIRQRLLQHRRRPGRGELPVRLRRRRHRGGQAQAQGVPQRRDSQDGERRRQFPPIGRIGQDAWFRREHTARRHHQSTGPERQGHRRIEPKRAC
jgi:hypothetical protein